MRAVIAIATVALAAPGALLDAQTRGTQTPPALKVTNAVVSDSEDGPPFAQRGAVFLPGDTLFFSFQVENYRMGLTGKVQLTGHVQAFDPSGIPIVAA